MQTFSRVVRLKGVSRYEGNGRKDDCGGETTAGRALHRGDLSKPRGHVSRGELPSDDAALFDRPIAPREAENIWALVERLDALYSVPLVMAYAEGMKLEEIAAALHVPKGTVSARMTRGRQKLKTWMEEER